MLFGGLLCCALAWQANAVLTQSQIDQFLLLHNNAKIATNASDQYRYTWSSAIAATAQAYANTCPSGHSTSGSVYRPTGIGENLAWGWPSRTIASTMQGFVDKERPYYNFATNTCASGQQCGHYTQVVWAQTNMVGCGYAHCSSLSAGGYTGSGDIWVCQYGPTGNYIGQWPYTPATSSAPKCSMCIGTCVNGLCTKPTSCQTGLYQISGASVRSDMNGYYGRIVPATVNGKLRLAGAGTGYQIYWANNRWFLDTDTNPSGYYGYIYSTASTPPTSGWTVYGSSGWVVDSSLQITTCPTSRRDGEDNQAASQDSELLSLGSSSDEPAQDPSFVGATGDGSYQSIEQLDQQPSDPDKSIGNPASVFHQSNSVGVQQHPEEQPIANDVGAPRRDMDAASPADSTHHYPISLAFAVLASIGMTALAL
jgi:hypothetical protein